MGRVRQCGDMDAGFGIRLQTGYRSQGSFGQAQNFANFVLLRLPHKAVAAALSLSPLPQNQIWTGWT